MSEPISVTLPPIDAGPTGFPPHGNRLLHIQVGVAVAWCGIILFGFTLMVQHDQDGTLAKARPAIQQALPIPVTYGPDFHIVMFAHPHCECTLASLEELSLLLAESCGHLDATVELFRPSTEPDAWSEGECLSRVQQMPGVRLRYDTDAHLAKQCGARISGQVLLYNSEGRLLFCGGITGARGFAGENTGLQTVRQLISTPSNVIASGVASSTVFGCALYSQESTLDRFITPSGYAGLR